MLWLQLLAVIAQPRYLATQQYAFHHITLVPTLSLHPHLRSARHAAVRRRVSTNSRDHLLCLSFTDSAREKKPV